MLVLPARLYASLAMCLVLSACDQEQTQSFTAVEPGEQLSAGIGTVTKSDHNAFSLPSANLSPSRRLDFGVGNSFFRNPWLIAPSTISARDGLGPLFNTNTCQSCHIKDGRGHPPTSDSDNAVSMLVRLSIPVKPGQEALLERHGVIPEPVYGSQLQDVAIPGAVPEGRIRVNYTSELVTLKDGTRIELQKPELEILQLGYGSLHPDTLFSARVAPPMIGLGLLEAIPEAAILANADPGDLDRDGISGRPNRVWDHASQSSRLGRFGWKAGQPSINQQNADAFFNDLGLSTSLIAGSNCGEAQLGCLQLPSGGQPEVSDHILAQVLFYTRNLGVPVRRKFDDPQVRQGKGLFHEAGCQRCHIPSFTTAANAAEPELVSQVIRPYTDLLLHDMGKGLADDRPEFLANGREWRTPPLWGLGLTETVSGHTRFLHDGRARSSLEAILWHGGEAEGARKAVMDFDAEQRAALQAFINSL